MIYCGSFVHVLRVNILRSFIISLKHVWRRREERFTVLSQNNTSDRVNGFLSVSGLCKCVFSSLCPTSFSNLVCVWVFTKKPLSCMKVIVILRLCVCLTVNGCVCVINGGGYLTAGDRPRGQRCSDGSIRLL